jgi:hypothetical protein
MANLARTPDEVNALLEEWGGFQQCEILGVWLEPPARRLEIHTSNLGAAAADPNYPRRPGRIVVQGVQYFHAGSPLVPDAPARVSSMEFREFTDFWSIAVYYMGTYEHLTVFAKGPLTLEFDDAPAGA